MVSLQRFAGAWDADLRTGHLNHFPLARRGRRSLTFLDTVVRDTGVQLDDLRTAMCNREVWRKIVNGISIEDRPK